MRSRALACLAATWLICLHVVLITAQEAKSLPSVEDRIKSAIEQLGADYEQAEIAERELLKLVQAEDPRLIAAAAATNFGTAGRAQIILGELKRRELENAKHKLSWDELRKRIAAHAASDDWKAPGWRDEVIEGALQNLLNQINHHLPSDPIILPSKIAGEVDERRLGQRRIDRQQSVLSVSHGNYKATYSDREVLLVDGSVRLGMATDSIIIATGAVTIERGGSGCIVIAGEFADVRYFPGLRRESPERGRWGGRGSEGRDTAPVQRSYRNLVLSGGPIRGSGQSHAGIGTIGYCPLKPDPNSEQLVRRPPVPEDLARLRESMRPVELENLKLTILPKAMPNKLKDQLKIKQVFQEQGRDQAGVESPFLILEQGDVETILRPGQEICDSQGRPIPALAGWKLDMVSEDHTNDYAMFSNGKEYAGFVLESSLARILREAEARQAEAK